MPSTRALLERIGVLQQARRPQGKRVSRYASNNGSVAMSSTITARPRQAAVPQAPVPGPIFAVDRIGVFGRQAGRSQRMQATLIVRTHHRGQHVRCDAFDLGADQRHHLDQRAFLHQGFQHAVLQYLVHLGVGDVGQYRHVMRGSVVGVVDRVEVERDPQRCAVLAIDQQVGAGVLQGIGAIANAGDLALVALGAGQDIGGRRPTSSASV